MPLVIRTARMRVLPHGARCQVRQRNKGVYIYNIYSHVRQPLLGGLDVVAPFGGIRLAFGKLQRRAVLGRSSCLPVFVRHFHLAEFVHFDLASTCVC